MEPLSKILIIADETPLSEKAIRFGYFIANQMQAEVALLNVDDSGEQPMDTLMPYDMMDGENHYKRAKAFLEEMEKKYSNGTPTRIFMAEGGVKESVLAHATLWDAQLIVAGTHARKGLSRLFMGSVSESILHDTEIPMLIVPMDKA